MGCHLPGWVRYGWPTTACPDRVYGYQCINGKTDAVCGYLLGSDHRGPFTWTCVTDCTTRDEAATAVGLDRGCWTYSEGQVPDWMLRDGGVDFTPSRDCLAYGYVICFPADGGDCASVCSPR